MSHEPKVAVVSIVRNEEKSVDSMIKGLQNQSLSPYRIIIVDDGSTDKTLQVASQFEKAELVSRNNRDESYIAKKELATTFNVGLEKLLHDNLCEFIAIITPDLILPSNYLNVIVNRMQENSKLAIASGTIQGEYSSDPRGAGRIVRYNFWKSIGLKYPVNYGFEGYLVLKAQSLGYSTNVFSDLIMTGSRKTGSKYKPQLYYNYGKGIKALGYTFLYALIRILLFGKRNPKGAYYMFKGYFSKDVELYEKDLRDFVRKTQRSKLLRIDPEYLKRFFKKLVYEK